jgi:exopolyphosphatase / guanosine-5'-triphosphate,3'-diphosphate pyrophosphatase
MADLKKIAVLDIGISTVMLLLVSSKKTGEFEILNEFGGISKLGEGLRRNNTLSNTAVNRTINICKEVINIAKKEKPDEIIITVTSSINKAINKTEFLVKCQTALDIFPHILAQNDEINYIYKGALTSFSKTERPIINLDVRGDKTYISFGTKDMLVGSNVIDIGSFYLPAGVSRKKSIFCFCSPLQKYINQHTERIIKDINHWLEERKPIIICSGNTLTMYANIVAKQIQYNRQHVDKKLYKTNELEKNVKKLCALNLKTRKKISGMELERADSFPTGINILLIILKQLGAKHFQITSNGLRTGIAKSCIEKSHF